MLALGGKGWLSVMVGGKVIWFMGEVEGGLRTIFVLLYVLEALLG